MAPLLEKGAVTKRTRRAPGFSRVLIEYGLTDVGRSEVQALSDTLSSTSVAVRRAGVGGECMTVSQLLQLREPRLSLWQVLSQIEGHGGVDLDAGPVTRQLGTRYQRDLADAPAAVEFVGRVEELATFARWLEGNRPVFVLEGPGGIGKTTLVAHALRSQDLHRHVLWIRIRGTFTGKEIIEQLDGFLATLGRPAALPSGDNPIAFASALRARVKGFPMLVVFDDVQKAETALSRILEAMVNVASTSATLKVTLIGRRVLLPENPLRDALHRNLTPFTAMEAGQLLAAKGLQPADQATLLKAGAGNPLFLELLARMPEAAGRRSDFTRSLGRDLASALSPQQLEILKWVSALRTPAPSTLFDQLGLGSPKALSELVAASLLVTDDERRFDMHDVVREALYEQVEFRERRRVHESLAEAFKPKDADWSGMTEYLHHLVRAGRGNDALRWVMGNRTQLVEKAHALFAQPPTMG